MATQEKGSAHKDAPANAAEPAPRERARDESSDAFAPTLIAARSARTADPLGATLGPDGEPATATDPPSGPPVVAVNPEAARPGPSDPSASLETFVGKVIENRYEVLSEVSRGGMGVVYRARHIHLDTPVALKILLRPQGQRNQSLFMREARLASKVRHPNLVFISDFGLLPDGRSYLAMELLSGRPLSREIANGKMEPGRACRVALQIAAGLTAVHEAGIVHRGL